MIPRSFSTAVLLCVVTLVAGPAFGAEFPALEDSHDPQLQQALEARIEELSLGRLAANGQLAVTLVDITDPTRPLLAEVNGRRMLYAASLPKIAILLGAFERLAEQGASPDAEMEGRLTRMIRHSSNVDATAVLDFVGGHYLADLLVSDRYALYKEGTGGLWVGKPYGSAPAFYRDPQFGISHGATSHEVARFYYMLDTGRLVSPESCARMKAIMSDPAIPHKFVAGLNSIDSEARIYRKSGTWRTYHSDSALIERQGRRYIAVALANDANAGQWLPRLLVAMDKAVFARAGHMPESVAVAR